MGDVQFVGTGLDGADFTGAILFGSVFRGVDLTNAHGIEQGQLREACADESTKLPAGLVVAKCPSGNGSQPDSPQCQK